MTQPTPTGWRIAARFGDMSVGGKFVSLCVMLLALMLVTSIWAFVQIQKVTAETRTLTGVIEPLARAMDIIEQQIADQALFMEHARSHAGALTPSADHGTSDADRFARLSTDIVRRLDAADATVRDNQANAGRADLTIAFGRLDLQIDNLRREHGHYQEAAMALFALPPDTPQILVADRERALAVLETHLVAAIKRLSDEADQLDEADEIRQGSLERRAFVVSANNLGLAVFAFLTGSILSYLLTRRMLGRVHNLIQGTQEIGRGNFDVEMPPPRGDEIGQLATAFSTMAGQLRTKAAMRETFGNYVDPRVVDRLLNDDSSGLEAGERRCMTVFFSDMEGFSRISETLTPTALVKLINRYLSLASEPIHAQQGVIDKYIGDAIMAYWGEPFTSGDHALNACRAALAQQKQTDVLRTELPELLGLRRGAPQINVRIGLSTGDVVVGSIGSQTSKSFTIMGDTVNIASRLEGANKSYGTQTLVDEATAAALAGAIETREIDLLAAVGKTEPVRIFELLGERGSTNLLRLELRDAFAAALASYRACDWDRAEAGFHEALRIWPDDPPSLILAARTAALREQPPGKDWSGVWQAVAK